MTEISLIVTLNKFTHSLTHSHLPYSEKRQKGIYDGCYMPTEGGAFTPQETPSIPIWDLLMLQLLRPITPSIDPEGISPNHDLAFTGLELITELYFFTIITLALSTEL